MTVGEIAGLIAAFAFVFLVGMCAIPLLKLRQGARRTDRCRQGRQLATDPDPERTQGDRGRHQRRDRQDRRRHGSEVEKVTADVAKVSGHAIDGGGEHRHAVQDHDWPPSDARSSALASTLARLRTAIAPRPAS
jgi:hypothetical protein